MRFWGITGTNGKTTCTWIFAEFVNACAGRKCGYITTVEAYDGKDRYYTGYTTPPLKTLHEIYAKMEANGCTDCVMEVSSHAIHQNRTGDTVFSGGAFTNLSEDHLDYHKTMEEYFRVKASFAEKIASQHPTRPDMGRMDLPPYVVCMDGEYGERMFNAVGNFSVNVIRVSRDGNPVHAARPESAPYRIPNYDLSELKLVGAYNESNVLTSAALAEAADVPREIIQATISKLVPRWGRLEEVKSKSEKVKSRVFVDFAHTPDGLEKVLTAVRGMMTAQAARPESAPYHGELWVVFGAGGDRDPMKRPLMGAACAKLADRLVVTSDNPRSEEPMAIIDAILKGVDEVKGNREQGIGVVVEPDRKKAIEYALRNAKEGDVVVIAGKGHETTQEIKGVKYPFDDREMVRDFVL